MNASATHAAAARAASPFDADVAGRGFDGGNVWRLLGWLRPYRGLVFAALGLVLLSAAAAVLAPIVIGRVVVDGILLPHAGNAPDYGQTALNQWLAAGLGWPPLASACLLYAFWIGLFTLSAHGFRLLFARAALNGLRDLRRDIFRHIEHLPASFYDRVSAGRVMTRLTNDVETLFEFLSGFGTLFGDLLPFFIAISIMLSLDRTLALEMLAFLPFVGVATWLFRSRSRQLYREIRSSVSRLNESLAENLAGMEVIQLYGRQQRNEAAHDAINRENQAAEGRAIRLETYYNPFIDSLEYLALGAIVWLGGHHVLGGATSVGALILFAQFSDMLFRPVRALGEQWNVVFRASASCERVFQALDWHEPMVRPLTPIPLPANLRGQLELRHLDFAYRSGEPVLKDVNLEVAPGECIAFVGPTGSGKTTVTRLLCRFYDVPENTVFLDGIDIMHVAPEDIRRRIGVVLQDFHIFSGTVYDNIALGDPAITREKAEAAARLVNAAPFIERLPQGYDTPLNERGSNLSQGQRQLLAFARVLALDPEILILDEATASIDTETELLIHDALDKLKAGRTSIIIAHRLQTIREADRIVVLEHGRVAEVGCHRELLAKGGLYKRLYELQAQGV